MRQPLFGELLRQFVDLSDHDVSEILEDQSLSHRRFGEVAMAFQLCRPQHVWQAWWAQLGSNLEKIALPAVGVDTQALSALPRSLAEQYPVIPIRAYANQLVLAATEGSEPRARLELPSQLSKEIRFVIAPETQIRDAIAKYYLREAI